MNFSRNVGETPHEENAVRSFGRCTLNMPLVFVSTPRPEKVAQVQAQESASNVCDGRGSAVAEHPL